MQRSGPRILEAIVRACVRRPWRTLAAAALLSLAAAVLALGLRPSAGTDTLVGKGTADYKATQEHRERFGDDAVVILVKEDLPELLLTSDLNRMLGLEGCIAGNVPQGVTPPGGPDGPCSRLAEFKPIQVVYGPGTFINEAARQLTEQFSAQTAANAEQAKRAAKAARKLARAQGKSGAEANRLADQAKQLVQAEFVRDTLRLAVQYGIRSVPRIDDPDFVSTLVFDPARGVATPKARFAYLFPNKSSALVQARLRPGLSDAQRDEAIALVREATAMPNWKLQRGGEYVVSGVPVVVSDLAAEVSDAIIVLLLVALVVMALTLAAVLRLPPRLAPLAVALAATAVTFGGMALAGIELTMASIAVLPVLIGLAVDYAIQFQFRFHEARADGARTPEEAALAAVRAGGPTIAAAVLATAAGFAVLALSPVPMVRSFGLLLVAGVAVAFLAALTAGAAGLVAAARSAASPGRFARAAGPSWRGAGELLGGAASRARRVLAASPLGRPGRAIGRRGAGAWRGALRAAQARPGRVLAIAAAVAVVGWAADTQTEVVSDVTELVPQSLPAMGGVRQLQEETGVSGQIDVMVKARGLTDPAVVRWMSDYQQRLLRRYGYSSKTGCGKATLCPALSLPDLFRSGQATSDRARIRALLDAVPPYFSQAVVSPDRRAATLAFGIRLMPLDRQQEVIDEMRRELDPPSGVQATLVGLPVLAAKANAQLSSEWRRFGTLAAGLAAVLLVLLLVLRTASRALVPLIPIALATGWSALVLFVLRIPLNPMSATLGALVIAITTEFSVLLSERYRQERIAGLSPAEALRATYASTGAAVGASAATAIAGFGVLIASDIRMLRDFGIVTVVDLAVSLAGVLLVLPAALTLAERRAAATAREPRRRTRLRMRRPGRAPAA